MPRDAVQIVKETSKIEIRDQMQHVDPEETGCVSTVV